MRSVYLGRGQVPRYLCETQKVTPEGVTQKSRREGVLEIVSQVRTGEAREVETHLTSPV